MFELPQLSYEFNSLEPYIDAKTMEIHYDKHHAGYVNKLNLALKKFPELEGKKVEELLTDNLKIVPTDIKTAVKNNGGGHFNHSLFWKILTSNIEYKKFSGKIAEKIEEVFGGSDEFKKLFSAEAMGRFGSGWAWLVFSDGLLEIISTINQDSPIMNNKIPLVGLDVWEHAYYLKYQNRRADYVDAFFNVINWKKVDEIYSSLI